MLENQRKRLAFGGRIGPFSGMVLPTQPVTLTVGQIEELNSHLSNMRHDINNHLSLIVAAVELLRQKPQTLERMVATLIEQPPKIAEAITNFSTDFESRFGIVRR